MRYTLPVLAIAAGAVVLTGGVALATTSDVPASARPVTFAAGAAMKKAPATTAMGTAAATDIAKVAATARPLQISDCDSFQVEVTAIDAKPAESGADRLTTLRVH